MRQVLATSVVTWADRSVREGFFMFWETLWPLVLGFGLSGAVQAFVPREPSPAAWADDASYTMADLTMLRRELIVGYLVAGVLTVAVATQAWNAVFIHCHGVWTSIENVVVRPFIAVISFVCSIGNVPPAAARWKGGSASAA